MSFLYLLLGQDGHEIESFSTICSNNGQWHLPLPECHSMLALSWVKTYTENKTQKSIWSFSLCRWQHIFCSSAVIDCGEPEPLLNGGLTFQSGFKNQYLSVVEYHCDEPFYVHLGGINGKILQSNT